MTDAQLQAEHREWVDRMYPGQPPYVPAAGMVEEAGELLHAVLKLEQEERWGCDPRHKDLREQLIDAVGDCAVYCCSYCNATDQTFSTDCKADTVGSKLTLAVQLVRVAANVAYGVYAYDWRYYMGMLKCLALALDIDFDAAVESTWKLVKGRTR